MVTATKKGLFNVQVEGATWLEAEWKEEGKEDREIADLIRKSLRNFVCGTQVKCYTLSPAPG